MSKKYLHCLFSKCICIGMKPNEIRAEMVRRKITVVSIAKSLGVKQPTVSQVIYGIRPTRRIRQAIADSICRKIDEIWPENIEEAEK